MRRQRLWLGLSGTALGLFFALGMLGSVAFAQETDSAGIGDSLSVTVTRGARPSKLPLVLEVTGGVVVLGALAGAYVYYRKSAARGGQAPV